MQHNKIGGHEMEAGAGGEGGGAPHRENPKICPISPSETNGGSRGAHLYGHNLSGQELPPVHAGHGRHPALPHGAPKNCLVKINPKITQAQSQIRTDPTLGYTNPGAESDKEQPNTGLYLNFPLRINKVSIYLSIYLPIY
ncbi:hypothetical protein AALO_G00306740 [Alosa alosa]|uniref:Uncharacterized protein n=1 Tax=Alosa alosa TaxID=278164 RepID=A0AAV6FGH9_9TELE|nr:hypothetical protein AALO_G00306740 [Alosa alosa]